MGIGVGHGTGVTINHGTVKPPSPGNGPPISGPDRKSHPFGNEDNPFDVATGKYPPLIVEGGAVQDYDPAGNDLAFVKPLEFLVRDENKTQRWIKIEDLFNLLALGELSPEAQAAFNRLIQSWVERNSVWAYAQVQDLYSEGTKKFETVSRQYRVLGVDNSLTNRLRSTVFVAEECP